MFREAQNMSSTDFLEELAELALGSRLKRLSDRLMSDASQIYKIFGHDVQSKWFGLLALLDKKKTVSVVEASELLGLTQPAISQFVKELLARGIVVSEASSTDSRRKLISLNQQGRQLVADMKPMWRAVESAASDLCIEAGDAFFESIKSLETAISRRTLLERTMQIVDEGAVNLDVEILEFTPELAPFFSAINEEWINAMFEIEQSDRDVLDEPQKLIIDKGGKIFFARLPDLGVVGTCALLIKDDYGFELTKMGVLEKARGKKIGETLLAYVIREANKMNIDNLYLLTNRDCKAAIHLYEKYGFQHDEKTMNLFSGKYARSDVAMRYWKINS